MIAAVLGAMLLLAACEDDNELILATTTSTQDSGLLDMLIPLYEEESGNSVTLIAVGSGAAIEMGARGDADALLVHSPAAEQKFMDEGHGESRDRVMYNDFIIVGPANDPAGIAGSADPAAALAAIAAAGARFYSRGDDSGTHTKEQGLWMSAGLEVPQGESWYTETGQGMSATLTIAVEQGGYTLTDRATWLAMELGDRLPIAVEGAESLLNVYHVIVVDPGKHDEVHVEPARAFRDFMLSAGTLAVVETFGVEEFGQPLFVPYPD